MKKEQIMIYNIRNDFRKIAQDIKNLIARESATMISVGLDAKQVRPTSKLYDDLGFDLVDVMELVWRLEDTFGIHIAEESLDISELETPLGLYRKVRNVMRARPIKMRDTSHQNAAVR
jgi:acyl carrier protein